MADEKTEGEPVTPVMAPPPESAANDPLDTQSLGNTSTAVGHQHNMVPPIEPKQDDDRRGQKLHIDALGKGVGIDWAEDITRRVEDLEGKMKGDVAQPTVESNNIQSATASNRNIIPVAKDCNWERFKNRYHPDEGIPAVELLIAGHDLDREIEDEQLRRLDTDARKTFLAAEKMNARRTKVYQSNIDDRIDRVRINSRAVLSLLAEVSGQLTWKSDQPHVFLSPFKIPIFFQGEMEKELESLARALSEMPAEAEDFDKAAAPSLAPNSTSKSFKGHGLLEDAATAREAYQEIKCYVEFVQNRLLPTYHGREVETHDKRTKIRFSELWSLFRVGELVVQPVEDTSDPKLSSRGRQMQTGANQASEPRVWKVFKIEGAETDWEVDSLDVSGSKLRRSREFEGTEEFIVRVYRLDYDGSKYASVERKFWIDPYEKERDITKLIVYPIRFQRDSEAVMKRFQERGEKFQHLVKQERRSMEHDGWTLTKDPSGDDLEGRSYDRLTTVHIDSNVIIDFSEAYQSHPSWKPVFSTVIDQAWATSSKQDAFPIIQWSGPAHARELSRVTEVVIEDDDICELEWQKLAETDNFIVDPEQQFERAQGGEPHTVDHQVLTDADAMLLPARLMVYSLRDRQFVNAHIDSVKIPVEIPDPFADLKIEAAEKNFIKSIVRDHFEKKRIQRQLQIYGDKAMEQDFIPGKGRGLTILLHGPPGVGKTATAEAVAYSHRRPLFPITCGDLGTEPDTVEDRLSTIFRLANTWDCILLLDEADIFLSKREKSDDSLQRNALVSVFLRILEYYPGVLFLTTNRVGVLDEALNSRVHISLFFKHLTWKQTRGLFQTNLARTKRIAEQRATICKEPPLLVNEDDIMDFALDQFEHHREVYPNAPWWNGRQIRNAFQIATSLAYAADPESSDNKQRLLDRSHFEQVHKAIEEFSDYRRTVQQGKSDSEWAAERLERGPNRRPPQPSRRNDSSFSFGQSPSASSQPRQFPSPHARNMSERPRGSGHYSSLTPPGAPYHGGPSTPARQSSEPLHDTGYNPSVKVHDGSAHFSAGSGHSSRAYDDNEASRLRFQEQDMYHE